MSCPPHEWDLEDKLEWLYRCALCKVYGRRIATGRTIGSRIVPRMCVHKGCKKIASVRLFGRLPAGRLRLTCAAHAPEEEKKAAIERASATAQKG
jgi:hypothetical protein